jgi:hypothetical protein
MKFNRNNCFSKFVFLFVVFWNLKNLNYLFPVRKKGDKTLEQNI